MEKDLVHASRRNIEKKILEDKNGTKNENGYTKSFKREVYEEQVAREEANKKEREEKSMFKEYNELIKKPDSGPLPIFGSDGRVR
jgi:hypothetical protein